MSHGEAPERYLLLLGAEQRQRERSVVSALRVYPGAVGCVTLSPIVNRSRLFDIHIEGDPREPGSALAAVERHADATGQRPAGVVPLNDWTLGSAVAVADRFGLPSLPREVVRDCRNKLAMRQALGAAGLVVPGYAGFRSYHELVRRVKRLRFPVVVKPAEFGGGGGVVKVDHHSELGEAYLHSQAILHEYSDGDLFVVEEYVAATAELSVEVLASGRAASVVAVTDKFLGPEPWFAEIGHAVPSAFSRRADVRELAIAACDALRIRRGMCHVEIRIRPDGEPVVVEVGARPGGDGIMDLVERAYGLSPYELHIRSWLGQLPPWLPTAAAGTAAVAFIKAPVGIVREVRYPESLPECVVGLELTARVGAASELPTDWRAREGIVELFTTAGGWPTGRTYPLEVAARLAGECVVVSPVSGVPA
jgi:biotin carboxylase